MRSILFFLTFMISMTFAQTTYVYNRDVGGKESTITWTVDSKDNDLHINGESVSGKTHIVTSLKHVTKTFNHISKTGQSEYSIVRDGYNLIAKKQINGKQIERRFNLRTALWVQEFDFSLKPFILSNDRNFKFSIIHPKNLDLHNMVATKQSFDKVDINGTIRDAIKVKITLTGFKKLFWHADLWFDPQAGDLLKYAATEGPNTPLSVITLFSKKS